MARVGIRDLKAHLSEYVGMARRGDTVVITDRGTAVARMVSIDSESALQRLLDEGLAMPPAHGVRPMPLPRATGGTVSDLTSTQRR